METRVDCNQCFVELCLERCEGEIIGNIGHGVLQFTCHFMNALKAQDCHKVQDTSKRQVIHIAIVKEWDRLDDRRNE